MLFMKWHSLIEFPLEVVPKWRHGIKGKERFCDDSFKTLILKSLTMEKGCQKPCDVIYELPFIIFMSISTLTR